MIVAIKNLKFKIVYLLEILFFSKAGSKTRFRRGFTLIEIVVATAVLIFLSGMVVLYGRRGESEIIFRQMKERIILNINEAKSMALYLKTLPSGETPCGYGIYFPSPDPRRGVNYYIIYAERKEAVVCNINGRNPNKSEDVRTYYLDYPIVISALSSSDLSISFPPPDAKVKFNPPQSEVFITLMNKASSLTSKIKINSLGGVSVEE